MEIQKGQHFTVTKDVEKATHWLANYDDKNKTDEVTPYHFYKVIYNPYDKEYVIRDNDGDISDIYLKHNGDFVIMEGLNGRS